MKHLHLEQSLARNSMMGISSPRTCVSSRQHLATRPVQDGYRQRATPDFTQKIGKVFRIANRGGVGRIEQIIRLIAGGFPLFCHYAAGRAFDFVDGNEVYHAPAKAGINHAAVLIGSGVHEYPGEGSKIYLRARGSRDDAANPQSALQGKGGDFNIWAEDVTDVLGFHLA